MKIPNKHFFIIRMSSIHILNVLVFFQASGFVVQVLDTRHLILAFFDSELNVESYAIAHFKNVFEQSGVDQSGVDQNVRQFEIDESNLSSLIYRQVSFDASPLEVPISLFDGGCYGWVAKKVTGHSQMTSRICCMLL